MFTGIIEEVGTAVSLEAGRLRIAAQAVLEGVKLGDSISVNGACLTVSSLVPRGFGADVVPETLRRTSLGDLRPGARVNLERAMAADGRFGGHLVQGHIEDTAVLDRFEPDGADGLMAYYRVPETLARYIVAKGFIAIDGVSLTVVATGPGYLSVTLVPFTRQHTNLTDRYPGERVNLETDVIARYVERLLGSGGPSQA